MNYKKTQKSKNKINLIFIEIFTKQTKNVIYN